MQDHHDGDPHTEQADRALVSVRLRVPGEAGHTARVSDAVRAAYPDRRLLERVLCAGPTLSIYVVYRMRQVLLDGRLDAQHGSRQNESGLMDARLEDFLTGEED